MAVKRPVKPAALWILRAPTSWDASGASSTPSGRYWATGAGTRSNWRSSRVQTRRPPCATCCRCAVLAALRTADDTQVRGEARTAVDGVREPGARVRVERGGHDLHEVDLRLGKLDLAVLVEPAVDVLLEAPCGRSVLGRHMLDAQLVVEPDVNPVHMGRQDVVGIFPACDPRVERDFAVRVGMQHHATAACSVRARQARPFEGFRDVIVEPMRLVPEAVVPRDLLVGKGAALPVEKVASLCRDDRAARSLVGDAVDGAL